MAERITSLRSLLPISELKPDLQKILNIGSFEALIDDNTKAIYLETIGNPGFDIPDFEAFSKLARKT